MPGTIQVTVLEFKGVSSSPQPSAMSLKVSMGKRQYQTWDKGDFSFPITKIRENLIVALLDAGGNEIAHQEIRTMQIVEKGCWDEVFSINGGGHVHLKLQFALSEEDRNRIRIMRESAMKKKLETNPNIKPRLSEAIASASDSEDTSTKNEEKLASDDEKRVVEIGGVEASQAGSATSSAVSLSKQGGSVLENAITNATDGSEGAPSSPPEHEIETESTRVLANIRSDKNNSVATKLEHNYPIQKSENEGAVGKTPSNVREMISAFENTQLQEVKSLKKASSVPSQLNRLRKGAGTVPSDHESLKELSSKNDRQKSEVTPVDLMRPSTSETATSSGRMPDQEQTRLTHLSSKSINSTMIMAANTLECYKEECCSGMWIFPDNTRRLCITTAGKHVVKMVGLGHHHNKPKTRANKISSESKVLEQNVMHEAEFIEEKKQKTIAHQLDSESGSSPDGSSNGLVGQIVKIAVIIGFGVLVLLTRQKEPRKKQREDNDNLYHVPEYVDDRTLPWIMKQ